MGLRGLTVTMFCSVCTEAPPVLSKAFEQLVLEKVHPSNAYWDFAPQFHRCWRHALPTYVDASINPFKLVSVDPDRIVRFSTRQYPTWDDNFKTFGAVLDGDWDRRDTPSVSPHDGPDPSLYFADRFTETPVHKAMEAHFIDNVPWEKTAFIQRILQQIKDEKSDQFVWHTCKTESEVHERCRFLDRLYADLRRRGCLSVRQLNVENGRPNTFPWVMENEILLDIGRDGELLFVEGRHRLSLAKILGLERVPVAINVRHTQWLDQRETLINRTSNVDGDDQTIHPDLRHEFGMESINIAW